MSKRIIVLLLSVFICAGSTFLTTYAEEVPDAEEPAEVTEGESAPEESGEPADTAEAESEDETAGNESSEILPVENAVAEEVISQQEETEPAESPEEEPAEDFDTETDTVSIEAEPEIITLDLLGTERFAINAYTFFVWLSQKEDQTEAVRTSAEDAAYLLTGSLSDTQLKDKKIIRQLPDVNASLAKYRQIIGSTSGYIGAYNNASSWECFKVSLEMIDIGNQRRALEHLAPLKISSLLMAEGIINVNAQPDNDLVHPQDFEASENLARCRGMAEDGEYIGMDPYVGWYDNEKKVFDYIVAQGWDPKQFNDFDAERIEQIRRYTGLPVQIGHYTNLISDNHVSTGFGTRFWGELTSSGYIGDFAQEFCPVFGYQGDADALTVEEYKALVTEYETEYARLNISLDKTQLTLEEGKTEKLTATVTPTGATGITVTWESSNPSVAAVSPDGTVTAIKEGTAVISASASDEENSSGSVLCTVNVQKPYVPVERVEISQTAVTINWKTYYQLSAKVYPENATFKNVYWSSDNSAVDVADAATGRIFGNNKGNATITARADGVTATCRVTVHKPVTGITLNSKTVELEKTGAWLIKATISPYDASDKRVTWSSSNKSVATVDSIGYVTAVGVGTTTITARTVDGNKTATCTVTVRPEQVHLSLQEKSIILEAGEKHQLVVTVYPADTPLVWHSNNTYVATVDSNGVVTAKHGGGITISVSTADGSVTAYCAVSVHETDPAPTPSGDPAACRAFGFCFYKGKDYWYENGVRQAVKGDPKNIIDEQYHQERGREIYDPESDGWYWLDSIYDGAKATGKEVWMPYIYQNEAEWSDAEAVRIAYESDPGMGDCVLDAIRNKKGKWVRYDENGKMLKGWVTIEGELAYLYPEQKGNRYYYDTRTGLMAKGWVTLNGVRHHFDEETGVLIN